MAIFIFPPVGGRSPSSEGSCDHVLFRALDLNKVTRLILVGDPNQLPQVSNGSHPDGAGGNPRRCNRLVASLATVMLREGSAGHRLAACSRSGRRHSGIRGGINAGQPDLCGWRWVRHDRLRLVSADELRGWAEDAGLVVELLAGGYDLGALGPGAERAVLIAVKP
jgi:hypothetical protein